MQVVNGFWDMLQQYFGQNVLYLFAVLSLILFLYRLEKQERRTALVAVLLLIGAVFNPVSYQILVNFTGQLKTYYRFFWTIPCEIMAAYLLYDSIRHINHLKQRLILVCALCAGFLILNTDFEEWKLPENSYQFSYDILEVAWKLDELRTEAGQEKVTILADTNICHAIREYDANICFPFTSYHVGKPKSVKGDAAAVMNMLMDNQDHLDGTIVTETLLSNEVDYLVIHADNTISLSYMQKLHWQIVSTTSAYHILQYQEPVFDTIPLKTAGLETEDVEVVIPGLAEEYHFLLLADLHIITENSEISSKELETVRSRQRWSSVSENVTAAEYWSDLPKILDSCNADAILLAGDMIDFCSTSNIECLKQGLDSLETPYMYIRADHDTSPFYCDGITKKDCRKLHTSIDGNDEIWCMEFSEFCIAGLSGNTGQISDSDLNRMKEIFANDKPVILLTHVPYQSTLDPDLEEASKEAWQDRALIWGENCYYQPDANTREFMNMIYAENSPVREILCGHLHFTWDGNIAENTHEHVFSPAFEQKVGVITVKGK